MDISTFNNSEFGEIRTIQKDDKVLFCGADIARALGYADTAKAIKLHCKEDGWAICPVIDSMGRNQQAKFIIEGRTSSNTHLSKRSAPGSLLCAIRR